MRERKEVQEVLRRLKPVVPATASHAHAPIPHESFHRTQTYDNLRKLPRGDGINRGGLPLPKKSR